LRLWEKETHPPHAKRMGTGWEAHQTLKFSLTHLMFSAAWRTHEYHRSIISLRAVSVF